MKKSLLVAALITGFAGVAQAETSVTLYGIVDGGIQYQQFKGTNAQGESFKARSTGLTSGLQSGSRWGLKGTEDLGNGLQAVFVLENGFNLGTGETSGDKLFGRQATIGLKSASWGQLDFGRQTTVSSKYLANVASPFGPDWGQASVGSAFSAINSVRYDNMIMYQTPNFAGFQLGVAYSFNTSGNQRFKTTGGAEPNERAWTTAARYANGPLAVGLSYDQFKTAENLQAPDNGVTVKAWNLAASYDFEVVKVHAAFGQTRNGWFKDNSALTAYDVNVQGLNSLTKGPNEGMKVNSYGLGLSAPVGANGTILAGWTLADPKNAGVDLVGTDLEKQQVYSLGYTYGLSKRTNVYALGSYARHVHFNDNLKATQLTVGLRHQF